MGFEKFCQSCMLPHKNELYKKGTEVDGTENDLYCSYCYDKGYFTNPEIKTANEMQGFVKKILKERGYGFIKRWFFTVGIPKLKRWANS